MAYGKSKQKEILKYMDSFLHQERAHACTFEIQKCVTKLMR